MRGRRRRTSLAGLRPVEVASVRAVDVEDGAYRAGDSGVVVFTAELRLHRGTDVAQDVGSEPSGLRPRAIGHDDVAPVVARDEDQDAVYTLLRERTLGGALQRGASQRRQRHHDDLFARRRIEAGDLRVELGDG